MARTGDTGPYSLDNIRKATWEENTQEWARSLRFKQLMKSEAYSNSIKSAWTDPERNTKLKKRCQSIHTPAGEFSSQSEAARHLGVTQGTIWHRLKTRPSEYYRKQI
jgi:hypothetical protein